MYNGFLVKWHTDVNYEDRTVAWAMDINTDKKKLENAAIKDDFTNKGLLLKADTVVITDSKGAKLVAGSDYKLENKGEAGFEIKFLKTVTDHLRLSYVTDYDTTQTVDGKNTFINKAQMTTTVNGKDFTIDGEATFTPEKESQNNGYKSGSYDYVKKQFNWTLGVNYNKEKVNKLVIKDVSPEGLKPLLDSFKVVKLNLANGGVGTDAGEFKNFTVVEKVIDGKPGFVLTFNEPISSAYKITYSSIDEDGVISKEYNNKASVEGTKKSSELTAKVPVTHGGELTSKRGVQDGDVIKWTVAFNMSQSNLTNATLIDTPTENTFVLEDSFKVFKATPTSDGKFQKGEEIAKSFYTVKIKDNGSFELKFNKDIKEAYYIEYDSYINAADGEFVANTAYAKSNEVTSDKSPSKESIKVVLTTSEGSGSGKTGFIND